MEDLRSNVGQLSLTSGILGLATHLWFHCNEPHRPLRLVLGTVVICPLVSVAYCRSWTMSHVLVAYLSYHIALSASIVLYRLSPFHPLAQYPGPLLFKITKLSGVWASYTGHQHYLLRDMHQQYGPVVRIGPNDLSIADVDAVPDVLGPEGLPKGRYYDARRDPNAPSNLLAMSPGDAHTRRRRLWNRALSSDALKDYEAIIARRARGLVQGIGHSSGARVDMASWINFFTFDFMGEMAFGANYGMLDSGTDRSGYLKVMEHFASSASMISHIPWSMPFFQHIPLVAKDLLKLRKLGIDSAMARMKGGSTSKDLWYHLTDEPGLENEQPQVRDVIADGALAIIAGADTTASGLVSLLFCLMSHPDCLRRLREEVDCAFPDGQDPLETSRHGELKYLNACINEALRLYPPVPTGGPRQVMKGMGTKLIGGRAIPEDTQIYVPPFVLQRAPQYWPESPDEFMPERWINEKAGQNSAAFIPFSFGPSNCVGRHLARREMVMVISTLVRTFDMEFAEGFDWKGWPDTLHDYFVSGRGPLVVQLQRREV